MELLEMALLGTTGLTLLMVGLHHARLVELRHLLRRDRDLEHSARQHIEENRELHSALRAEREHVSQLQRQVQLLLSLVP
ncbi:hypothetical protein [Pseudomonas sp. Teo4]|uniref:hypothetical protein n=1 Tax=Pseudomonas sp. Teo4 TaxID=3064528 RepID=UPI002ABD0A23|nr:hypothetical protein [Pseudomonas sp. Teo4]MDZ3990963.1 hypothetical protein [Pseudomonas sp. Teo4]